MKTPPGDRRGRFISPCAKRFCDTGPIPAAIAVRTGEPPKTAQISPNRPFSPISADLRASGPHSVSKCRTNSYTKLPLFASSIDPYGWRDWRENESQKVGNAVAIGAPGDFYACTRTDGATQILRQR